MPFKNNNKIDEGFVRRIDKALGLEGISGEPTATTSPALGATKGPSKGSTGRKYNAKKVRKKNKKIEKEVDEGSC